MPSRISTLILFFEIGKLVNEFEVNDWLTFNIHTASITIRTPAGGFVMALTKEISCCLRVSSADTAAFNAGMATANWSSHSS